MEQHFKRALVLGGANTVWDDIARAKSTWGEFDLVVAVNDIATTYPGRVDVWCSLHPEMIENWLDMRRMKGYNTDIELVVAGDRRLELKHTRRAPYYYHAFNSGSSGLLAATEALVYRRATHVVLAGIPMDRRAHFFNFRPWPDAIDYREAWLMASADTEFRSSVRSMSGWTQQLLGEPSGVWWRTTTAVEKLLDASLSSVV